MNKVLFCKGNLQYVLYGVMDHLKSKNVFCLGEIGDKRNIFFKFVHEMYRCGVTILS